MSLFRQSQRYVLRAMAKNYATGHRWDHLDGEAVIKAADEIVALETECDGLRELLRQVSEQTRHPDYDWDHSLIKDVQAALSVKP